MTAAKSTKSSKSTVTEPSPFDQLTLNALEQAAKEHSTLSQEAQFAMYRILEYLRVSNRFKENKTYKVSTFWKYLDDVFTIREKTYRTNVKAMNRHPEFAKTYGVGIVGSIMDKCGALKTEKVIKAISAAGEKSKTPLTRDKISVIIGKHSKKKIKKVSNDWKSMYEVESAAHDKTKQLLKDTLEENAELIEQVGKLKKSMEIVQSLRDMVMDNDKGRGGQPTMTQ